MAELRTIDVGASIRQGRALPCVCRRQEIDRHEVVLELEDGHLQHVRCLCGTRWLRINPPREG